jgi:hypothetical protein
LTATGVAAVAFVPIVADWAYKVFRSPRPYWIHYYDPEVAYYVGGMRLLEGRLPTNIEHPGTPLHMLTAALLWAGGRRELFDIEWFRPVAYAMALALSLLAAVLLAATVFGQLPPLLRVVALWSYFSTAGALQWNAIWGPEILFLPAGALVLVAATITFADPTPRWGIVLGAAFGLCLALKLTFLAWLPALVLAACVSARPWGRLARFLGALATGTMLSLALCTFVIRARWRAVAVWLAGVFLRSGQYGTGEVAWPAPHEVLANFQALIGSSKGLHLWWTLCVLLLAVRFYRGEAGGRRPGHAALMVLSVVGIAGSYVSAGRSAELRYLLPSGLMGMLLFTLSIDGWSPARGRVLQLAALTAMGALLGRSMGVDLAAHTLRVADGRSLGASVRAAVAHEAAPLGHPPVVVYGWRLPEPSFALRIESTEPDELAAISRRFPLSGHYIPWTRVISLPAGKSSWDLLVVSPEDLAHWPEPIGEVRARLNGYVVVAAPPRESIQTRQ